MFGRQSGLVNATGGSGQPLVEFRAGKMNMVKKMVHPDTRKGLVYLTQSEDGLIHFCWKDRVTGEVEDDLITFPEDFEFKRVEQCKTGRVYVLKFKSSPRRMFFWMQEPKTDKDDDFCRQVNETMNNPPSARGGGSEGGDLQYMLNNMSQQQLMQLFGGVGQMGGLSSLLGSMNRSSDNTTSRSVTTPTSNRGVASNNGGTGGGNVTPSAIARMPENAPFGPSVPKDLSSEGGGSHRLNVDLASALSGADSVNQLISDSERAELLSTHLPDIGIDEPAKQKLKDTLSSPQFQQALSLFSSALQSGQLGPVVSQFQLSPEAVAAANTGDLEQFIKALEKSAPKNQTDTEKKD